MAAQGAFRAGCFCALVEIKGRSEISTLVAGCLKTTLRGFTTSLKHIFLRILSLINLTMFAGSTVGTENVH